MSKHTPGPWEVRKDITKETLVCSENKTIICGIHQKNLNIISETEANANLIAAAPELFEAAEEMYKIIMDNGYNLKVSYESFDTIGNFVSRRQEWGEIISKAKGARE